LSPWQAIFGAYDYVADPKPRNPEHIRILGTWEQDNIVDVPISQLKKTTIGSKDPSTIRFHRLGAAQLQGLWKEWESAKLLDRILSFAGGFEPRFVRGSTATLSNHSFGSAFDINSEWNERGHRPALVGEKGSTSSFRLPINGASGGEAISPRRTACISRSPW